MFLLFSPAPYTTTRDSSPFCTCCQSSSFSTSSAVSIRRTWKYCGHYNTIINQTIDILFYPALLIVFLSRLAAWIHMLPRTPRTCHLFPGFLFSTCINQSIGNNGEKYLAPFWKWDKCMWIVWACLVSERFLLWNILVSSEFFNWWGKRGNCIEMKLLHLQILSKLHFSNIKTAFSSG